MSNIYTLYISLLLYIFILVCLCICVCIDVWVCGWVWVCGTFCRSVFSFRLFKTIVNILNLLGGTNFNKMKYIIYEMITPEHLQKVVQEGYGYTKTLYRNVLEKLNVSGVEAEHQTLEMAMAEIVSKKDKLKHLELTVLPVIAISWDGEVS